MPRHTRALVEPDRLSMSEASTELPEADAIAA